MDLPFIDGEYSSVNGRDISEETAKKYRYQQGTHKGKKVHIENYYDEDGTLVGQKLRDSKKNFVSIGDCSKSLFGRHCVPSGAKKLVITEGAIDAMSYAEARKGWYAVSIPNGASSAKKVIKANIPWLETFDSVIICFDNDEAGQQAAEGIKGLISPGRMKIAKLDGQYKDLNEAWQAGDVKAILNAEYNAEEVRPDGIVDLDDIFEDALKPIEWGLPWFIPELTDVTYGRRYGEVYGLGGPTGGGKTDFELEQIAYDCIELGQKTGIYFLEQKPVETAKRLAGKVGNKRFHVPGEGTQEELTEALQKFRGKIKFYDSFGQTEWDEVKNRIRHMALADGIRIFYIDHLTAMADTSDERGSLEQIMKELAGLANELGLIIHYVSHLATPDGKPHEEGGRIAIRHFKGSRAIGFWSFLMLALERNQQAEDEDERHTTTLRILKDRYTGQATGKTIELGYDAETGRILPPSAAGFGKDEEF